MWLKRNIDDFFPASVSIFPLPFCIAIVIREIRLKKISGFLVSYWSIFGGDTFYRQNQQRNQRTFGSPKKFVKSIIRYARPLFSTFALKIDLEQTFFLRDSFRVPVIPYRIMPSWLVLSVVGEKIHDILIDFV